MLPLQRGLHGLGFRCRLRRLYLGGGVQACVPRRGLAVGTHMRRMLALLAAALGGRACAHLGVRAIAHGLRWRAVQNPKGPALADG